jgi:hypothetical protein
LCKPVWLLLQLQRLLNVLFLQGWLLLLMLPCLTLQLLLVYLHGCPCAVLLRCLLQGLLQV